MPKNGEPGVVFLRDLPAGVVLAYGDLKDEGEKTNALFDLIGQSVVNDKGQRIFSSNDQVARIRDMNIKVFNKLMSSVMGDVANPLGSAPVTPATATVTASAVATPSTPPVVNGSDSSTDSPSV
jgi:hypothetical protein